MVEAAAEKGNCVIVGRVHNMFSAIGLSRREMGFEQIIGSSQVLKHVLELANTVASSDSTVLLMGETGTGTS